MTLSPVFRSERAVALLAQEGIWQRLQPALALQAEAVARLHSDLAAVIGEPFRHTDGDRSNEPNLQLMQEYFFLTLFLSLFESLGVARWRLPFYAELNFCIMGTITAADNLFDDQEKSLLPLATPGGARYASILQLMCFERLLRRSGDRAITQNLMTGAEFERIQRGLIDRMAEIGRLEGSEEGGVEDIPDPRRMIDRVHRVRGGLLFSLAFIAPGVWEKQSLAEKLARAEPAIARLGTAFQIVDDLTDFEFDLGRRSHNLLVAQIHHAGGPEERARLDDLWRNGQPAATPGLRAAQPNSAVDPRAASDGLVETVFADSARAVLALARDEARASFATLADLGFWFPPRLADEVVHAIVGLDGAARMEALTSRENQ